MRVPLMEIKRPEQLLTSEDIAKMEAQVTEAKEILEDQALKEEADDINAQIQARREELAEQHNEDEGDILEPGASGTRLEQSMAEERSNFWTHVEKGGMSEVFYKVLMEELPGEGLSFNPGVKREDGTVDPDYVTVQTTPFKTDREFIDALAEHPAIELLLYPTIVDAQKRAQELESQGVLPAGTLPRALRRFYEDRIAHEENKKLWQDAIRKTELRNAVPLSNAELEEIIRHIVQQEYRKKLGL